ncbi:biotin-dependent carboxyltransferase family protein [Defluviimonas sp. WL0002]|uniref:Biotin-dependent carboxyltransferase family protein n=1 Tax=Albidovulum marisflavi TaxID=2984159 RepID=A0ABT2Z7A7_9RHOB|nr:biotin-dependent carboxyltransferase family protein [Defluviimonas sp. WL0002]MCV2867019.1 biotin-dependent carboxyltransferase family protein [Defluviimonas sp. WL0002]
MRHLVVTRAGPAMTVQDGGRLGMLMEGLSRGGAADSVALAEGAALLGQSVDLAALEMAGHGGAFTVSDTTRIALTGAPMRADIDGKSLPWNASHVIAPGQTLTVGGCEKGTYGYLHLGGGIATQPILGSRAAHLVAGIGGLVQAGDRLPLGPDARTEPGLVLGVDDRFSGGAIRIVESAQSALFTASERARFEATDFTRDVRANRMGVRLTMEGEGFAADRQLSILSEVIVPGDIQVTGDGTPFVLLPECQTTGGYPRIGTVIPADLPAVAQAGPGALLRFRFVSFEEALEAERRHRTMLRDLPRRPRHAVRDPRDMPDLLSYRLIDGMISAHDT